MTLCRAYRLQNKLNKFDNNIKELVKEFNLSIIDEVDYHDHIYHNTWFYDEYDACEFIGDSALVLSHIQNLNREQNPESCSDSIASDLNNYCIYMAIDLFDEHRDAHRLEVEEELEKIFCVDISNNIIEMLYN